MHSVVLVWLHKVSNSQSEVKDGPHYSFSLLDRATAINKIHVHVCIVLF